MVARREGGSDLPRRDYNRLTIPEILLMEIAVNRYVLAEGYRVCGVVVSAAPAPPR